MEINVNQMENGYWQVSVGGISQIGTDKEQLEKEFTVFVEDLGKRLNRKEKVINDIMELIGF